MRAHFSALASRVVWLLTGEIAEAMGIRGRLDRESGRLSYAFVPRKEIEPVFDVAPLEGHRPRFGKMLRAMGLRLDSGRLVGMIHLRDCVFDLVKGHRLDGELVWAEERARSRLLFLAREYGLPWSESTSLQLMQNILANSAGTWVQSGGLRRGPTFPVDELLADLARLIYSGRTTVPAPANGSSLASAHRTPGQ